MRKSAFLFIGSRVFVLPAVVVEVPIIMFVAVVCEFSSDDTRSEVYQLLKQYGFERIYKDVFESFSIKSTILARLKRDIDRLTDFYDRVRMYQFPLDETFAITALHDKKWRKTVVKADTEIGG